MQSNFTTKIEDFAKWCREAINDYNNGKYSSAMLNMRKGGEAGCKLIFYYKDPEKVAQDTERLPFQKLIDAIKRRNLAEPEIITWLPVIQLYGNKGAHDAHVDKAKAEAAIKGFKIFILWMYDTYIGKSSMPLGLKQAIDLLDNPAKNEPTPSQSKLQKKLNEKTKETEYLRGVIASGGATKPEEAPKIKKPEPEKKVAKQKENKQEKEKPLPPNVNPKDSNVYSQANTQQTTTPSGSAKAPWYLFYKHSIPTGLKIALGAAGVILILISGLYLKHRSRVNDTRTSLISPNASLSVDSLHILILPFTVMQENPNMKLKFEDAVISRIRQRIQEKNMPVSVFYDKDFIKPAITDNEAMEEAKKYRANTVLFGEIYEPLTSA